MSTNAKPIPMIATGLHSASIHSDPTDVNVQADLKKTLQGVTISMSVALVIIPVIPLQPALTHMESTSASVVVVTLARAGNASTRMNALQVDIAVQSALTARIVLARINVSAIPDTKC